MGDARGRFEGNTLVIETTNFTDKTAIGGVRHSEQLRLTERFTRVDPEMIDYEIRVEDPLTWEQPWTLRMTITQQPGYEIYEYSCHEGNIAMQARADSANAPTRRRPPKPRRKGCRRRSASSSE